MPAPGTSGRSEMTRYDVTGYLRERAISSEYSAETTAAKKFML
jgi:hypothetical protein